MGDIVAIPASVCCVWRMANATKRCSTRFTSTVIITHPPIEVVEKNYRAISRQIGGVFKMLSRIGRIFTFLFVPRTKTRRVTQHSLQYRQTLLVGTVTLLRCNVFFFFFF